MAIGSGRSRVEVQERAGRVPEPRTHSGGKKESGFGAGVLPGVGEELEPWRGRLTAAGPAATAHVVAQLKDRHGNLWVQRMVEGHREGGSPDGPAVQRQEKEEDKLKLSLLPPSLSMPLGPLDFSATTSAAQLSYREGPFSAGLGYEYGGPLSARIGRSAEGLTSSLGYSFDPEKGSAFQASMGYREGPFSAKGSYGYGEKGSSVSLGLGYGSTLLPMPSDLSKSVYGAEAGLRGALGALPGALEDPMAAYRAQSENIDRIKKAAGLMGRLGGAAGSGFGAGLQFNYDPEKWSLMAGAQYVY